MRLAHRLPHVLIVAIAIAFVMGGPVALAMTGYSDAVPGAHFPAIAWPTRAPILTKAQNAALVGAARKKIKHVVFILQENRSFDSYFGTYPGADGLIGASVCLPTPAGGCQGPYADHADVNGGGPHGHDSFLGDVNHGAMDGFLKVAGKARLNCADPNDPACADTNGTDVMGYHTQSDIPNYWAYAHHFVLQDHLFEPVSSWSLPDHLYSVSEWSAYCPSIDPMSCTTKDQNLSVVPPNGLDGARNPPSPKDPTYAWTDLTYLLHKAGVSWGYFVSPGTEPDCEDADAITCKPVSQKGKTPGIWNPLPDFTTVREDHQLANIAPTKKFLQDARKGTLPAVSWIIPSGATSEHPPNRVSDGQSYVTKLVNAVMKSSDWSSTAIFISWDDWGGFYDHVLPPRIDASGYGLRVPGLVISPWAKRGYIDHHNMSFDANVRLVEDLFLNGQRLDPATDGRPDRRPTVREDTAHTGNLLDDFNFSRRPRRPLILPEHPHTTLTG